MQLNSTGIGFKRLDHLLISIPPQRREKARQFYTEVLGLKEIPGVHPRGAMWFNMGDIELHVREGEGAGINSDRHPAFEVEDLEEAKASLQRKGVQLFGSTKIDGRERCFFRDPFGNRFELIEYDKGAAGAPVKDAIQKQFVSQKVQPALLGFMDGSVSTLAPIFASAGLTGKPLSAFFVGLAASLGAGISMGLAESLTDDGTITGRGKPAVRGIITGAGTTLGGMFHTFPFLVPEYDLALKIAYCVVMFELLAIAYVKYRFMNTRLLSAIIQVIVGGAIVLFIGLYFGKMA